MKEIIIIVVFVTGVVLGMYISSQIDKNINQ